MKEVASAPSASSANRFLFSDLKYGGCACRAIPANRTDHADATDGLSRSRTHPDHSCPGPAFARERDLDAQGAQERLRPPQSTGQRPRISGPRWPSRGLVRTLRTQTPEL